MSLDHAQICARIPHAGAMCLLAAVDSWSEQDIVCRADSHRRSDHPLQAAGRLHILHGIEYAAQAMAVHGALQADRQSKPAVGYLASVRDVRWYCQWLDEIAEDLRIRAERLSGDARMVLYAFSLETGTRVLMSGRASVVPDASAVQVAHTDGASR